MNTVIVHCFQEGAFSNVYRRLVKSALTAFALIAAAFTANAANVTWTGEGGDTLWSTPGNWNTGNVPTETDVAVFPSGKTYTVKLAHNHSSTTKDVCAAIVVDGDVTFARNDIWADIVIYGDNNTGGYATVSGSGTLTLDKTGLYLNTGTGIEIDCNFVANGGTVSDDASYIEMSTAGSTIVFKKPATVNSNGGHFRTQNGPATFESSVTIAANSELRVSSFGSQNRISIQGVVTVGEGGKLNASGGPINFVSRFTILSGYTLTAGTGGAVINSANVLGAGTVGKLIIGASGNTDTMVVENGTFTTKDLNVGNGGTATLTIGDGGIVQVGTANSKAWLRLAEATGGSGTINLNQGGTLEACCILRVNPDGYINFDGGTLKAYAVDGSHKLIEQNTTIVKVLENGAIVDVVSGIQATINTALASGVAQGETDGGLTKKGDGTLIVEVVPTYNGKTKVEAGILYLPAGDYTVDPDESTMELETSSLANYREFIKKADVAKVEKDGATTTFTSVAAAIASLEGEAGTVTLIASSPEAVTIGEGQQLVLDNFTIGSVTATDGRVAGIVDGTWQTYATNESETWNGGVSGAWNVAANWDKGFVPLATTPVTFPEGKWTAGLYNANQANQQCASLTVNGDVTLVRRSDGWADLILNGDIDGDGMLTINNTGLRNRSDERPNEVSCAFAITGNDNVMSGRWKISGNVTVDGMWKVQKLDGQTNLGVEVTASASLTENADLQLLTPLTFSGKTTVSGNFKVTNSWGNGYVAAFKDVEVVADASLPNNHITLGGEVTVDVGKTLTIPANVNVDNGASFKLGGAGSTIVDGKKTLNNSKVSCSDSNYWACNMNGTWVVGVRWTGAANDGGNWNTVGNWSNGVVPGENTVIAFPADATVKLPGTDAKGTCKEMVVDGNVEIVGGTIKDEIMLKGNVYGSGTLTMTGSGLHSNISGATLLVEPNVIFRNAPGVTDNPQPWLAGGAITINGNVTFVDAFKAWNTTHTIAGTTTLPGPTFNVADGSGLTLGAVIVPENATVTVSRQKNTTLTFNGTTTIKADATLTIPNDNKVVIGNNAKFVLELGAKLNANGSTAVNGKVSGATGTVVGLLNGTYTAYANGTGEEWSGGSSGGNWNDAANWSLGYVPLSTTPVAFNGDATVNIDNGARNCGPIKINNNANVVIVGTGSGAEIRLNGDITGEGTLTFRGSGPKRVSGSGIIASTVAVVFENGANNGPWLSFGFAVNGPVSLGDKLASWDAQNTINGTTTFRESTFAISGGGANLVLGPINVTRDLELNTGTASLYLNGEATIAAGATLMIAPSKVIIDSGASFELEPGAMLIDRTKTLTSGSTKVSCSEESGTLTATDTGAAIVWSSRTVTWAGGASGDWSTGSNWEGGSAPTASDTVIFNNSAAVTVTVGDGCAAGALVFNGSATVTLNGGTLNAGFVNVKDSALVVASGATLNARTLVGPCTLNNVGLTINAGGYAKFTDPIECGYDKLNVSVNGTLECEGDITVGSTAQNSNFGVNGNTGRVIAKGFFKIGNKRIECYVPHFEIGADGLGSKTQDYVLMFHQSTDVRALADFEIIAPRSTRTSDGYDWGVAIQEGTTFTVNTEGHTVTWGSGLSVRTSTNTFKDNDTSSKLAKTGKGTLVLKDSCVDPRDTSNTGTGFTKIHGGGTYVYDGTLEIRADNQFRAASANAKVILAGLDATLVDYNNYASGKVTPGTDWAINSEKDGNKMTYTVQIKFTPEGGGAAIIVPTEWITNHCKGAVANASDLTTMKPTNNSGYSYFECYALGLNTEKEDKPIVDVEVVDGKYVFTMKHPVYVNGEITGYEEVEAPDGVTLTPTLKYSNNVTDLDSSALTTGETTIAPASLPFGENNNVIYYKAVINIGAGTTTP